MMRARTCVLILLSGATAGFASAQDGQLSEVTTADDGSVLVVGFAAKHMMFGGDVNYPLLGPFALQFSPDDHIGWTHPSLPESRHSQQQAGSDGSAFYIAEYDNSNYCLQTGKCQDPSGSVIRRNAEGILEWRADIGAAVPGPGTFRAVRVGPRTGGGACFTAMRQGSGTVIGLIGPGGEFVWTYDLGTNHGAAGRVVTAATDDGCLFGGHLACSGGGCTGPVLTTLVLPGDYTLSVPDEHAFLARVSDAGVTSWAQTVTGSGGRRLSLENLRTQGDRIYIGGAIYFELDTYVAALSLDGDVLWMREPTGNPPFSSVGQTNGLASDNQGGVYVAGSHAVVALDHAGVEQSRVIIEGSLYLLDIANSDNRVFAVGMGTGAISVGGAAAELSPFWGGFIMTLTNDLQLERVISMEAHPVRIDDGLELYSGVQMRLFPNPARGRLTLAITVDRPQRAYVEIFDVLGRSRGVVFDGTLTGGESNLELAGLPLPSGVYICRVVGESGTAVAGFTVVD
jgi:hypothetical protein